MQKSGSVLLGAGILLAVLAFIAALLLRGIAPPVESTVVQTPTELPAQAEATAAVPGMPPCSSTVPCETVVATLETLETLETPVATGTPEPDPGAGAVFGLAWFHKPPEDGTTPEQLSEAHSYVHLTGLADIDYRDDLRRAGYDGPIYTYMTANAVEGPGPYSNSGEECEAGYTPYDNTLAWQKDDFCRYIHPNESWFLHNGEGERLVDDYFGSGRWTYLMNPADPGWQAFSQERLAQMKDEWGYDGVWLDNVDLDLARARNDVQNDDGQVREFDNDVEWQAAMKEWLGGVRGAVGDWPVWANLVGGGLGASSWDPFAPYLDGAMDESFAVSWLDRWRSPDQWRGQLERASRWLQSGKGLVMVGQGAQDDEQRLNFTLASYLLVAEGDEAFYRYTRFDQYYRAVWLYPEFDEARKLGMPQGPREEVVPGVWRREFTNGTVEVDLTINEGRIDLK